MTMVTVIDNAGRRASFEAAADERILYSGLIAAIGLPYECASGTCGSCKARCLAGQVETLWSEAPGRSVLRRADELLMCQARCAGSEPVELSIRTALPSAPRPPVERRSGVLRRAALLTADVGRFEIDLGRPLGYDAGQFVLVEMEGCAGPRAYSMTRASDGTGSLGLLIRRFEGGEFTERLFAPSFEACRVSVVGPLGRAVFGADEARPFVALAGGSGIAGMLGILDAAAACGQFARHRNAVVFGVRDARAAYLLDELDAMASSAGEGLCVVVAFSDMAPDAESRIRFPHLRFASGFVHEVAAQLPEGLIGPDTVHFVAGPPLMVDATLRWLVLDRKVPTTEIRYDRFG